MEHEAIKDRITAFGDLFAARECVVCGKRLLRKERYMCIYCAADLPLTHYWDRSHNPMADKFNILINNDIANNVLADDGYPAKSGTGTHEEYGNAVALFFYDYESGYGRITQRLKYHADLEEGGYFGEMLGKAMLSAAWLQTVSMVIPVPLHWSRYWKRGYNQAAVLGRAIAKACGAKFSDRVICRNRRTATQVHLSGKEKAANVHGAFSVRKRSLESLLETCHILIVDDVFTSGSTLHECYLTLKACLKGHSYQPKISIATLGYVKEGRTPDFFAGSDQEIESGKGKIY